MIILGVIFLFPVGRSVVAEAQHDCDDPTAALDGKKRVEATPNDFEIQGLHALRLGICEKIEAGSLTLDQDMTIFKQEREKAVQKRFEENRAKKERSF